MNIYIHNVLVHESLSLKTQVNDKLFMPNPVWIFLPYAQLLSYSIPLNPLTDVQRHIRLYIPYIHPVNTSNLEPNLDHLHPTNFPGFSKQSASTISTEIAFHLIWTLGRLDVSRVPLWWLGGCPPGSRCWYWTATYFFRSSWQWHVNYVHRV